MIFETERNTLSLKILQSTRRDLVLIGRTDLARQIDAIAPVLAQAIPIVEEAFRMEDAVFAQLSEQEFDRMCDDLPKGRHREGNHLEGIRT